MKILLLGFCLTTGLAIGAQALPSPQTPATYPNYSIMLINPAGGGVVLMHNPKNEMEYVDVTKTEDAFKAGYVPVRVEEIADLINYLKGENDRLASEIVRLKGPQLQQPPTVVVIAPQSQQAAPSPAQIEAQQRAQAAAENAARRQQLIQAFMLMQNNRPQPYQLPMPVNPNANRLHTTCTSSSMGGTTTTNCN